MTATHAIVLAAGRGSRLGSLTEDRPKCLVPVAGRPLLEWQIAALSGAGITAIAAVRGYGAAQLERPDLTFFENPRWAETNMVRSLEYAADWLRRVPCVISYSDIVYLTPTVRALNSSSADLALTYDLNWRAQWEARFRDPLVDAETFAVNGAHDVIDIGRKPSSLSEVNGQYMGLLKFTPDGWAVVERLLAGLDPSTVDRLDMTGMLQRLIAAGTRVHGVAIADPWFEIDSQTDLDACERTLRVRPEFRAAP